MAGVMRAAADSRGWGNEAPAKSAGRRTWAATAWLVAGTIAVAVTSYSLSLKVAAERRDMEKLARQNTALESDLKALDAELRVRMRMPQLQRWNDTVLGMVPISATQYLGSPLQLADYGKPPETAPQPRVQLAVRDIAPARPAMTAPLLVKADLPVAAAPAAIQRVSAPAAAAPERAVPIVRPVSTAQSGAQISRPAATAPDDLLQQVEMTFGPADGPTN